MKVVCGFLVLVLLLLLTSSAQLQNPVARQNFIRDKKDAILGSEGMNTISIASIEHGD